MHRPSLRDERHRVVISFPWSCPSDGRRALRHDYAAHRRVAARPRKALLAGSDPGRQAEGSEGLLPSRLEPGKEREQ
jgi:hypothetical protein